MRFLTSLLPVALLMAAAAPHANAQSAVRVDGDDITITGCVLPENSQSLAPADMIAWSPSGLMMAAASAAVRPAAPVGTSGTAERVFYWLDEDLTKYVGHLVEIEGDLEDLRTGTVEIDRDGDFTEIELDVDDIEETARIPSSWMPAGMTDDDVELDIAARKIDVDDVRVTGVCGRF